MRPRYNPFRVLTEKQIRRRALADTRLMTRPLSREINQSAAAGSRNVEGVYGRLAAELGNLQGATAGIYGQARSRLEALGQGSQQALGQAGGQIGGALDQALALSGNQPSGFGSEIARVQGAAGARSGAELGELALRQAAAEEFAAKLPTLTRLAGAQQVGMLEAQRRKDLSELSTRAQASLGDRLDTYRKRNFDSAVARTGLLGDQYDYEASLASTRARERQAAADRQFKAREAARDRAFELRKAEADRQFEMQQAQREWAQSDKSDAAKRRFDAKQAEIDRKFKARQAAADRKAYGQGNKGQGGSGVQPKD